MNAEVLLEHFHRLGDAPDAVPRLRRFILDLAVGGKLVERSAKNDQHSGWLAFSRTVAAQTEQPYEIPSHWRWAQLDHAADCRAGSKVAPSAIDPGDWVLDLEDIDGEAGVVVARATYSERSSKSTKAAFNVGDVLYGKLRPYLNKVVIADTPGYCTTEIIPIRPKPFLTSGFLRCFLRSAYFLGYAAKRNYGMKMPRLGTKDLEGALVPIPPPEEQHLIVAKVDELMALCDRLEAAQQQREQERTRLTAASWQALVTEGGTEAARFALEELPALTTRPAQVKALRQTILDLAVRGKLVEQDAKDEPAEVLLKRIAKEKESQSTKSKRQTAKAQTRSDVTGPFELPAGWSWASFPELGKFGRGKSKHRPRNDRSLYVDGTYPLVQTGDVARSKGVVTTYTNLYNDVGLAQSAMWPKGTLCITVAANIADSGILSFDACFPDSVVGFVPAACFSNARYFEYFLRTAKADLLEFAPATAQKNINLEILEAVRIPLPPLAEQGRIVAKVDALMGLCDRLEAALVEGEAVGGRLLEAVLHTEAVPRTQPPAPVQLRVATGAPKPQRVYVEAEVELAMAAEPVAGLVKRGPGRPRKAPVTGENDTAEAILGYLQAHTGWHGKAAILEATGLDASEWNGTIKELLEAGKVERQGEKKGARYRGR